ncbi:MAG: tRNA lysidine(34) synthetase TilS [Myxococcota bacterium]
MLLSAVERALGAAGEARTGEGRVLVACSGGRDSAVLADAVARILGARRVILGHVDHAVRPGSAEDARFVEAIAAGLGAAALTEVLPPGSDDEARLRELRYQALERMRVIARASLILTAHTADDQAETVLFGLLRSTHPASLRGIRRRNGHLLRPLLSVSRAEVGRYARAESVKYREDPTNLEPRYLRNRIRKELLPLIESRYRAGFAERLAALAEEAAVPMNELPAPLVPQVGAEVDRIEHTLEMTRAPWSGGEVPRDRQTAVFDAAELPSLIVRGASPGDRVRPFGLGGSKKLQDVLVDAKVPRAERTWVRVVAAPDGEILWVPGLVRSARAPVTASTREVWILTCGGRSSESL